MPKLPPMTKHKWLFRPAFPIRTFSLQSAVHLPSPRLLPDVSVNLIVKPFLHEADANFLARLYDYFGTEPFLFERGNLDAGRISSVFGREISPLAIQSRSTQQIIRRYWRS